MYFISKRVQILMNFQVAEPFKYFPYL